MALEFPRWACPAGRPHVIVNNQAELDAVMATAIVQDEPAPVEAKPAPKARRTKAARAS